MTLYLFLAVFGVVLQGAGAYSLQFAVTRRWATVSRRRTVLLYSEVPRGESEFTETPAKFVTASEANAPQGYLSSDMNKMEDGKQSRVLAYIALALVPCLMLVPFFLSRDFVPPTIE